MTGTSFFTAKEIWLYWQNWIEPNRNKKESNQVFSSKKVAMYRFNINKGKNIMVVHYSTQSISTKLRALYIYFTDNIYGSSWNGHKNNKIR